jgi:hypothetical protein
MNRTIIGVVVALLMLFSAACSSAPAGLSPTVKRIEALDSAFDHAHPGLVNCEATTYALLASSWMNMQRGGQGEPPQAVTVEYGGKSAIADAYMPFYDALVAYASAHGTRGYGAVSTVTGGPSGGYVLRHGQLRYVAGQLARICLAALPPSATPSASAPASQPTASFPTPTPEYIGPPGCPGSAQLMTAWNAAPTSVFRSQGISKRLSISGFNDISCWRGWVVASPIANANGTVEFYEQTGLHMLSRTEMRQFNSAVCSSRDSPAAWKNPAAGPATCSP